MLITIALLLGFTSPVDDEAFEVLPRDVEWSDVTSSFDLTYQLPFARPDREANDVLPKLEALLALRDENAADARLKSFATLVEAARPKGRFDAAVLAELLDADSPVARAAKPVASQLLADSFLRSKKWKPSKDHDADGVVMLEDAELPEFRCSPWKDLRGSDNLHAAAVLVFSDLEAITQVEHDFRTYLEHPGNSYERIGPAPDSYLRGIDEWGLPFAQVVMRFESDLPWPFSTYEADVKMLHRFDQKERLVTDLYAKAKDFYWLAGQDVFFPVLKEDGELVAYLLVRRYGFDLDGVPDKASHRKEALRGSLANLKRDAEKCFLESGRKLEYKAAWLPEFRLLGPK